MLAAGIALSIVGLGFFCWLLFTLAIYALPTFAGLSTGLAAFHSGAGVLGALVVGFLAGAATLAFGQLVVASSRTPLIRTAIGLIYGVPAAIAGYQVSFALAGIGMPSGGWHAAFAVIGAVVAGCTAASPGLKQVRHAEGGPLAVCRPPAGAGQPVPIGVATAVAPVAGRFHTMMTWECPDGVASTKPASSAARIDATFLCCMCA